MPQHVIVDGSNLATEGRTAPSLKQLNEAVDAYRADHPEALITVVVDATFGHRIDPKEVPEFERAIETNAFVAPPAGAVGRGDGFILSIAQKVKATILSNDSYQEFHGEYAWLFDEGRLVGGKPVPHVGWVFVNRTPVRGPVSRRSVKEQKVVEKSPGRRRGGKAVVDAPSISADAPMPIPKSAPPGAVMPAAKRAARPESTSSERAADRQPDKPTTPKSANDLLAFLSFVEHHPVGTTVQAVVNSYSSHGAYVLMGDAHGYVPLRLMADPAPRSAREAMALGDTVTLVVHSFAAGRRSIDLAVPAMAPDAAPAAPARGRRAVAKEATAPAATTRKQPGRKQATAPAPEVVVAPPTSETATARRGRAPKAAAPVVVEAKVPAVAKVAATPKAARPGLAKRVPKAAAPDQAPAAPVASAQPARGSKKAAAPAPVPATKSAPTKAAPTKSAPTKAAPEKSAPTKAAPTAKSASRRTGAAKSVRS